MPTPQQQIESFTVVRNGLPRVDWHSLQEEFAQRDTSYVEACACAKVWLQSLATALSDQAVHSGTENFLVVEAPRELTAHAVLGSAERSHALILKHLHGIATETTLPTALIVLHEQDDYYTYISDFYPEEGEFASSGGVFMDFGYPQIVLPGKDRSQQDSTVAHELTHALLSHLPIPRWLDEGFAVSMERLVVGPAFNLSMEDIQEHRAFWDEETIQEFWSGESFFRPDDGNRLSYQLAEVMLQTLAKNYDVLVDFANQANAEDGGQAAARNIYGRCLGELPTGLLGQGPWAPIGLPAENSPNEDHPAEAEHG